MFYPLRKNSEKPYGGVGIPPPPLYVRGLIVPKLPRNSPNLIRKKEGIFLFTDGLQIISKYKYVDHEHITAG